MNSTAAQCHTKQTLHDAYRAFRAVPSANNFLALEKEMLAYQDSRSSREYSKPGFMEQMGVDALAKGVIG